MKDLDKYIGLQKLYLLQQGGVDNWEWYYESIEDYGDIETDMDLLYALESGGVDNWSWYSESLEHFFEWRSHVREHWNTNDYMDYDEFVETLQDD